MVEPDRDRAGPPPGAVEFSRDASGFIVTVRGDLDGLLGWGAEALIGQPSTSFIHPQDQSSAVMAWMEMIDDPGRPHQWRGRYRRADGDWAWVETVNTNRLDDPDHRCVLSLMYGISHGELSVEEQLRAREELLAQLADALPVGLVQFDADGVIRFTNDRLHVILGQHDADRVETLLSGADPDDRRALDAAVRGVLAGDAVDELEVRGASGGDRRVVCSVSLRPLTDADGNVTGAVATVHDITDGARLRRQLERRAMIDDLTSCRNRRAILELLDESLDAMAAADHGIAVVYVDLDDFKRINDTYGHAVGDRVLSAAAQRIQRAVRTSDHVGRLGGDEFLVVCPAVRDADAAEEIADRVRSAMRWSIDTGSDSIAVTASVGRAFSAEAIDPDELVASADADMYRAKQVASG